MNDSSTGGYIAPLPAPAPLYDQALEAFIQAIVAGITGIDGTLVRPRWQAEPPNLPDISIDWCAIGGNEIGGDFNSSITHDASGVDKQQRQEELELLASFYGPNGEANASKLKDGLFVSQNREVMIAGGVSFKEAGRILNVPSFIKQRWYRKYDLPITLVRLTHRSYPVLNIEQLILNLQARK